MYVAFWLRKCCFGLLFCSAAGCVNDGRTTDTSASDKNKLTQEEARQYFESFAGRLETRSNEEEYGLFPLGNFTPEWDKAEVSADGRISCIDLPMHKEYGYAVTRNYGTSDAYEVNVSYEFLIVKDRRTGEMANYVHFFIPDRAYAEIFDCDIAELYTNCEKRDDDYSGIELYTTLDGFVVAAARYEYGKLTASVFLPDRRIPEEERYGRLVRIVRNIRIRQQGVRCETRLVSDKRNEYDFDPMGRDVFIANDGCTYKVIYYPDGQCALELLEWSFGIYHVYCNGPLSDPGVGGGMSHDGSDSSGNGSGGNSGSEGGGSGGIGGGLGPGGGPCGATGGSGGSGEIGGVGGTGGSGSGGGLTKHDTYLPSPVNPIPGDGTNGSGDPDPRPCVDRIACVSDPLLEMKISDDNRGWKSNTWGYVRRDRNRKPKFHDGLDLAGVRGESVVYAIYPGKVTLVIADQPYPDSQGNYPPGYRGDKNGAGNRITIETGLPDGTKIQISYWHLDTKEHNPYTQSFKVGDFVLWGQEIGVVGNTGNAFNMKSHLHVKTYIDETNPKTDERNNPFKYLYTKFDPDTGTITRGCND